MAQCQTAHWELDCGEGHGCGLVEDSETGELLGWFCASQMMKGRRRPQGDQDRYIDRSVTIAFCCRDITRAQLAEALDDLVDVELVVPKGKYSEKVTHCATATLDEIIRAVGLSTRD